MLSHSVPAIVHRAQELRGQKEQRRRDRERAAIQASRAFHENRVDEAIALLIPFKEDEDLRRSSKMFLHVAEKRNIEPNMALQPFATRRTPTRRASWWKYLIGEIPGTSRV